MFRLVWRWYNSLWIPCRTHALMLWDVLEIFVHVKSTVIVDISDNIWNLVTCYIHLPVNRKHVDFCWYLEREKKAINAPLFGTVKVLYTNPILLHSTKHLLQQSKIAPNILELSCFKSICLFIKYLSKSFTISTNEWTFSPISGWTAWEWYREERWRLRVESLREKS